MNIAKYCLALCLLASSVASAPGQRYSEVGPGQIDVALEQDGPDPLPYQPVRLRITFKNLTKQSINPGLPHFEEDLQFLELKGPEDQDFRPIRTATQLTQPFRGLACIYRNLPPVYLEAGGRRSLSFPLVAYWAPMKIGAPEWFPDSPVQPLFPKPDAYTFRYYYRCDPTKSLQSKATIVRTLTVKVKEPAEKDRAVLDTLAQDNRLYGDIMNVLWWTPTKEDVPKLQAILRDHPDSAYAPYARLALARHYAAYSDPSRRVSRAKAADEAEKLLGTDFALRPSAFRVMVDCDPEYRQKSLESLFNEFYDAIEWRPITWQGRLGIKPPQPHPEPSTGNGPE
jgi:hypothetical protein